METRSRHIPLGSLLFLALLGPSAAVAEDAPQAAAPVQMAPVNVTAGPLGSVGIRCAVEIGLFALVSGNAHIKGMTISEVVKGSAAEKAGLMAQDRILAIDGTPTTAYTVNDLRKIREKEKGDMMKFVVQGPADKSPRTAEVTLGARRPREK